MDIRLFWYAWEGNGLWFNGVRHLEASLVSPQKDVTWRVGGHARANVNCIRNSGGYSEIDTVAIQGLLYVCFQVT